MRSLDESFWMLLQRSRRAALAVDFDGTLAPFQSDRLAARPLPGVLEALAAIADWGHCVAVLSGRPLAELSPLLGPRAESLFLSGSHGWEIRRPGQAVEVKPVAAEVSRRLQRAAEMAEQIRLKELPHEPVPPDAPVEIKHASVAAHVRGVSAESTEKWFRRLRPVWEALAYPDLEVMDFNGGIELRVPDQDKGRALQAFLINCPVHDLAVYIGDDLTDEDAFRALPPEGVGVKVGIGPTAADYWVADPSAVAWLLKRWRELLLTKGGEDEQAGGGVEPAAAHTEEPG